jgi:NAD(P)H dehydrogenase (quinone)
MADAIGASAEKVAGVEVDVRAVDSVDVGDLTGFDAIVIGSPTYYGSMAAAVKQMLDESVAFHGQLAGKVGGAFASSANVGGGNETTIMDILKALMIHGMVVVGSSAGDHYGPVAIGDLDDRSSNQCANYGRMVAELAVRLAGG